VGAEQLPECCGHMAEQEAEQVAPIDGACLRDAAAVDGDWGAAAAGRARGGAMRGGLFMVVGEAEAEVDRAAGGATAHGDRGRGCCAGWPCTRRGHAPGALHSRGGGGGLQGASGEDGAIIASGGRL
jgi:hypothetical protein